MECIVDIYVVLRGMIEFLTARLSSSAQLQTSLLHSIPHRSCHENCGFSDPAGIEG
jgi:hypothetical protein